MSTLLLPGAERSPDFFGIFFALGGVSQSLLRRLDGIISIIFVTRENVEVKMKGMLVTGRLIILTGGYAVTFVNFLHDQRNFLGDIKNPVAIFGGQCVNAFKMFIRNKDHMPSIFTHEERINKASYKVVFVNDVAGLHERIRTFFLLDANANRTDVVIWSVAFNHMVIISQPKDRLWLRKVRSTCLSHFMTELFYRYKLTNNSWQGWQDSNRSATISLLHLKREFGPRLVMRHVIPGTSARHLLCDLVKRIM